MQLIRAAVVFGATTSLLAAEALADEMPELRLISSVKVADSSKGFDEPSGLAFDPHTVRLWAVSDDTRRLFQIGTAGALDLDLSPRFPFTDLEGIAVLPDRQLAVVQEGKNEIIVVDRDGEVQRRKRVGDMSGHDGIRPHFQSASDTKGLEGITADPATGAIYVIKEAEPRLLLELSPDLEQIVQVHRLESGFGDDDDLDVSGLAYGVFCACLWIVSDTGEKVFLFDLQSGNVQSRALVRGERGQKSVRNAEGVALNAAGNVLFIITDDDEDSRLISYELLRMP